MFLLQDLKATGTERAATDSISQASEWTTVPDENKERSLSLKHNMCMSIYLYNPAILTPVYNEQFRLSKRKAHFFSVNLTCLIRTRVNTVNEDFFCVPSHRLSYIANLASRTRGICAIS